MPLAGGKLSMQDRTIRWAAFSQFVLALAVLVAAMTRPTNGPILVFIGASFVAAALILVAVFGPLISGKNFAQTALGFLFNGRLSARSIIIILLSAFLGIEAYSLIVPIGNLPTLGIYISFLLIWPWLALACLLKFGNRHRAVRFVSILFNISLSLNICLILIEIIGHVGYTVLPSDLRYWIRLTGGTFGINDQTASEAREFPPHEHAHYVMDGRTGDLYVASCLPVPTQPLFAPYSVDFTRDDHGFRNPTPWPDHPDLVITGDSFVAGEAVQSPFWDGIDPSILELGLPSSGPGEQLLLLRAFALPRSPRIVILAFFEGNDLGDAYHFQQVQNSGESYYTYEMNSNLLGQVLITTQLPLWYLARHSSSCPYPIQDSLGNSLAFFDSFFPMLTLDAQHLEQSPFYEPTRQAIVAAAKESKAVGATFVLMFIPEKSHVHWPFLSEEQITEIARRVQVSPYEDSGSAPSPEMIAASMEANRNVQSALLAQLAEEQGFLYLDLTPSLQEDTRQGNSLYFYGDTHLNQQGHLAVRRALLAFLSDHGLLSMSSTLENHPHVR
jgi:hypothetical protein